MFVGGGFFRADSCVGIGGYIFWEVNCIPGVCLLYLEEWWWQVGIWRLNLALVALSANILVCKYVTVVHKFRFFK